MLVLPRVNARQWLCTTLMFGLLFVTSSFGWAQTVPTAPNWNQLSSERQQVLAPLASEWDSLESSRKTKWLAIADKFPSMSPERQARLQERMQSWAKMTPEQRRLARENYARAKKVDPEQKNQKWEQYQQLPDEEKQKLAADASSRKRVTALPVPNQSNNKTLPPIKSASKPALERSVTAKGATQSAITPAIRPDQAAPSSQAQK